MRNSYFSISGAVGTGMLAARKNRLSKGLLLDVQALAPHGFGGWRLTL
jgi:hypothetical protein